MIVAINTLHTASVSLLGFFLNFVTIRLILRHTIKEMRIYSRILLQTCFTDILTLSINLPIQPVFFADNGIGSVWSFGPAHFLPNPWQCLCFMALVFMMRFSTISLSSLFLYRYLILNWNVRMTGGRYGCLLLVVCLPIAVLPVCSFLSNQPSADNEKLTNPSVVEMLELDNDSIQGYSVALRANATNPLSNFTSTYAFALSIGTYAIVIFCGLSIQLFIRRHYKGPSMEKQRQINAQISIVLGIQAILPILSVLPQLLTNFHIIFKISPGSFLAYISIFSPAPAIWISALNPLVTMLSVRSYRLVFLKWILCTSEFPTASTTHFHQVQSVKSVSSRVAPFNATGGR